MNENPQSGGDFGKAIAATVLVHLLVAGWFWFDSRRQSPPKKHPAEVAVKQFLVQVDSDGPRVSVEPAGGVFHGPVEVRLRTIDEAGTIYYTTDEKEPTAQSTKYSAPLRVEKTTVLQIIAFDAYGNKSVLYRHRFQIDPAKKQPRLEAHLSPKGPLTAKGSLGVDFVAPASGTCMLRLGGDDALTGELLKESPCEKGKRLAFSVLAKKFPGRQHDISLYLVKAGRKGQKETLSFQTFLVEIERGDEGLYVYPLGGTYRKPVTVRIVRPKTIAVGVSVAGELPPPPSTSAPSEVTVRESGLLALRIAGTTPGKDQLRTFRYTVAPDAPEIHVRDGESKPLVLGSQAKNPHIAWESDIDGRYEIWLGEGDEPEEKPLATGYVMARTPMVTPIEIGKLVSGLNAVTIRVTRAPLPPFMPLSELRRPIEAPKILEATIIPRLGLAKPDPKKVPELTTYEEPERQPDAVNLKKQPETPKKNPLRHFKHVKPKLAKKRRTLDEILRNAPINKDPRRRPTTLDKIVGNIDGSPDSTSPLGQKGNVYAGKVAAKIQRYMTHPASISNGVLRKLKVEILITGIDAKGNVLRFEVYKSSGNTAFDSTARRTIKKFMFTEGGTAKLPEPPQKVLDFINREGLLVVIDGRLISR